MRVHVVVASKHGATAEIADVIAATLRGHGFTAETVELDGRDPVDLRLGPHDVVVLGSAIYAGRWTKAARHFLDRNDAELKLHRTYLFSSGPLDDMAGPPIDPTLIATIELDTGATEHHLFGGKLDRSQLSRAERIMAAAVRAPDGDFRDWDEVTAWADHLADDLHTAAA